MATRLPLTIFFSLLTFVAYADTADNVEWENDAGLTLTDKTAIIRIANSMGITEPRHASVFTQSPGGRKALIVESEIAVDGNRRSWREAWLCRKGWRCAFDRKGITEKPWYANNQIRNRELWRIHDADWHVDVELQAGVPYDDSKMIVLAIRHGELVNRLKTSLGPVKLNPVMPTLNADQVTKITKEESEERAYEVWLNVGGSLRRYPIKIRNNEVELHGISVSTAASAH